MAEKLTAFIENTLGIPVINKKGPPPPRDVKKFGVLGKLLKQEEQQTIDLGLDKDVYMMCITYRTSLDISKCQSGWKRSLEVPHHVMRAFCNTNNISFYVVANIEQNNPPGSCINRYTLNVDKDNNTTLYYYEYDKCCSTTTVNYIFCFDKDGVPKMPPYDADMFMLKGT